MKNSNVKTSNQSIYFMVEVMLQDGSTHLLGKPYSTLASAQKVYDLVNAYHELITEKAEQQLITSVYCARIIKLTADILDSTCFDLPF